MFCPKCSQQQASEVVRFCSRCGFLLTGVAEVVKNEGHLPAASQPGDKNLSTPRKKGFKQGLFALLLLILTSPVLLIIARALEIHPAPVFLTLFILFISCVLRMIYALMFESNEADFSHRMSLQNSPNFLSGQKRAGELPSPPANPLADFIPPKNMNWRDSDELAFQNVTDVTTKQLDKK